MKLRAILFTGFIALSFCACGGNPVGEKIDSPNPDTVATVDTISPTAFASVQSRVMSQIPELPVPCWINVDSTRIGTYVDIAREDEKVLFPENFTIPEEVRLFAFAKQQLDSNFTLVWYRMKVPESGNQDNWVVLYSKISPLDLHLVSTKGNGYAYSYVDSLGKWREVTITNDKMENVTVRKVQFEDGHFVTKDEQSQSFSDHSQSQAYINRFFK